MTSESHAPIVQPHDLEFFERELASFVPDRVFDAHAHMWADANMPAHRKSPILPPTAGYAEFSRLQQELHPGRQYAANVFHRIVPREHLDAANAWTGEQIERDADYRGLFICPPEQDPEWVKQEVGRLGLSGLKVYHTYADVDPTWDAHLPDYLPESYIELADDEGWVVMLHMVRARAVADPGNIKWIRYYCETYPRMRLILAHAARGFQPNHNLEGLPQLIGLDNLYFDSSGNCDQMAHQAIIRIIGHERLMYGTDLPASHFRGRSVPAADTFFWVYEDSPVWGEKHMQIEPVLIGLEHLRSMKWACWSERLSDAQVEDIFWNNAARLFGIGAG